MVKWEKFVVNVVNAKDDTVAVLAPITDADTIMFQKPCGTCEPLYPSWKYAYMGTQECLVSVVNEDNKYRIVWIAQRDHTYIGIIVVKHGLIYRKYEMMCIENLHEFNNESIQIAS